AARYRACIRSAHFLTAARYRACIRSAHFLTAARYRACIRSAHFLTAARYRACIRSAHFLTAAAYRACIRSAHFLTAARYRACIRSAHFLTAARYRACIRSAHFLTAARYRASIRSAHSLRNWDFILWLFLRRRRVNDAGLWISGTAIFFEEVIDPGTRAFQRAIRRRDVHLQQFQLIRGFRAVVYLHPDTGLLRNHFAPAIVCTAAWAVSKLLWASLRTYMLHVTSHAIEPCLA